MTSEEDISTAGSPLVRRRHGAFFGQSGENISSGKDEKSPGNSSYFLLCFFKYKIKLNFFKRYNTKRELAPQKKPSSFGRG